ncbi:MAG TPA: ATP-binding protein [Spirochaetota bacterium]|nr:ATP-binding protein [Spirochaetota bacterium]
MKINLNIFTRLFLNHLLVIILLLVLIFIFAGHLIQQSYIDTTADHLFKIAQAVKPDLSRQLLGKDRTEIQKYITKAGRNTKIRFTVITQNGTVIADSEEDPHNMENHKNRPEIKSAYSNHTGRSLRYSSTLEKNMLYIAVPVRNQIQGGHVLRVSQFIDKIDLLLVDMLIRILQVLLVIVILIVVLSFFFSRNIAKPIQKLVDASQKIAGGNFKTRIYIDRNDSLEELANNFNNMTEKIDRLFTELRLKKEELSLIINSISEILLVIGKDNKVKECNKSFLEYFAADNAVGRYYWDIIREPDFFEYINSLFKEKKHLVRELELNNNYYLVSASLMEALDQYIIIFHNISEMKKHQILKKDFIANASHELKTPLTSLKGYLEFIKDNPQNSEKYFNILMRNTDRIINIINDLLKLSTLEDKNFRLEREKIDLKELLGNVKYLFADKIKSNRVALKININDKLKPVYGDYLKIEELFINLIDNALKYTEGGMIRISVVQDREATEIVVKDNGIGIPAKDQSRIFERFYVVDKARSRKLGGTGLGLSIVKHIINLHQGSIRCESNAGEGTAFIIRLPLNLK